MARNIASNTRSPRANGCNSGYTLANFPFDQPATADWLIRTPDSFEFYVRSQTLLSASSGPQQERIRAFQHGTIKEFARASGSQRMIDDQKRPISYVAERSDVLDLLLRFIHPSIPSPSPQPATMTFRLLVAARKYGFSSAERRLKEWMPGLAESDPLLVYSLAVQYKMSDVAGLAAKATLGRDIKLMGVQELNGLPVGAYLELSTFRDTCADNAMKIVDDLSWMRELARRESWKPCFIHCHDENCRRPGNLAEWFKTYLR